MSWKTLDQMDLAGVAAYEEVDGLLADDTIDAVDITLPPSLHADIACKALRAGKHGFCEKPMAMNVKECKAMLAAQKRSGKLLQIGYRLYYEPRHLGVKSIGEKQALGKVKMIESSLGFRMARPNIWRMNPSTEFKGAAPCL